jgi:hypothetical protein
MNLCNIFQVLIVSPFNALYSTHAEFPTNDLINVTLNYFNVTQRFTLSHIEHLIAICK